MAKVWTLRDLEAQAQNPTGNTKKMVDLFFPDFNRNALTMKFIGVLVITYAVLVITNSMVTFFRVE